MSGKPSAPASASGPTDVRALLGAAREARRDGRIAEAATVLKRAVELIRGRAAAGDADEPPLAHAVAREVEALHESLERGPTSDARPPSGATDPGVLLRLIDFGRRVATETDPEKVLHIVLHEAIDLAGADRGFLLRVEGERFEYAVAHNLDWTEVEQPWFEVSRTLLHDVARNGRAAFLGSTTLPTEHPAALSLAERGVHAVACIPIAGAARTLGVLYLDRRSSPGGLEEQRSLLELLAGQAGAALENARIHSASARALEAANELIRRQRSEAERRVRYETLVGSSDAMQAVYKRLDLVVPTELPVVIQGETGTGKELVARLIHAQGPRTQCPLIAVNCAGLAESLLEAELFGHERGAFTGAERSRPGVFELAHRGTLFLDEVGDMSPRMQGELLRVLQSGELRRVGGRDTIHVDVRVIAATHRDLREMMARGAFRRDLFFRLNVLTLDLPPLRRRTEDIPLLVSELWAAIAPGTPPFRLSAAALRRLLAYPWPGNVRELENVLRHLAVLRQSIVDEGDLPPEVLAGGPGSGRPGTLREVEERAIRSALEAAGGQRAEAARILGIDRKTLRLKLKQLDVPGRG